LTTRAKSGSHGGEFALRALRARVFALPSFALFERMSTRRETAMPTLLRFLTLIGILVGLFYGSMFVLANFFEPQQHEMTKTIRDVKVK
jgi:hypothetical protein